MFEKCLIIRDLLQETCYLLFQPDNTATQPFSSTAFSKPYPQMSINLSNINTEEASRSNNATIMTSNQNLSVIEERSNENENTSHTKHESLINPFDEHFITNCVERILNTLRKSQFYLRFTGPLPKLQGTTELDLGNFLKFFIQTASESFFQNLNFVLKEKYNQVKTVFFSLLKENSFKLTCTFQCIQVAFS